MDYLSLNRISKSFGKEKLLDEVTLGVAQGENLVIFGPSGGGKTVLLRMIAGVETVTQGSIEVGGRDITFDPPEARGIGVALQNFALFPHMTAFDNIAAPLAARKKSQSEITDAVQKIAKLLKIAQVLHHFPKQLSNGQKQRTALARALVARPPLLLLDDPLRNVDAKLRFEMRLELPRLLREAGATVIYVTQDYREALALGDRIAILMGGKLLQIGTPRDIYEQPASIKVAQLFGDPTINIFDVTQAVRENGQDVHLTLGGGVIPLAGATAKAVRQAAHAGKKLWLGIRPEAIDFVWPGEGPGQGTGEGSGQGPGQGTNQIAHKNAVVIAAKLEAVNPLNERHVSFLTTQEGHDILCSRPADEGGDPNQLAEAAKGQVKLQFSPDKILVFGGDDGEIMAHHDDAAARDATGDATGGATRDAAMVTA
ncbi:MAG: ABC transporter ATP-binding protein [Candidatus Symbiobacter sp.]|nr:ABC transporter ATP-binding protein [Candidatus Symbiobacter sp.]